MSEASEGERVRTVESSLTSEPPHPTLSPLGTVAKGAASWFWRNKRPGRVMVWLQPVHFGLSAHVADKLRAGELSTSIRRRLKQIASRVSCS